MSLDNRLRAFLNVSPMRCLGLSEDTIHEADDSRCEDIVIVAVGVVGEEDRELDEEEFSFKRLIDFGRRCSEDERRMFMAVSKNISSPSSSSSSTSNSSLVE